MIRCSAFVLVAMVAGTVTTPFAVAGASVTFTKIADSTTPIPGGSGTFLNFGLSPDLSLDGQQLAFRGHGESPFQQGIYRYIDGVIEVVADLSTPPPVGGGAFVGFSQPSVSGDVIAFSRPSTTGSLGVINPAAC